VSRRNGNNVNSNGTEKKITCRRCGNKFRVKVGKNDDYVRSVNCPECGADNKFKVDGKGKVHGPAAI